MTSQSQFRGRYKDPISKVRRHRSPTCDFSHVRPPLSQGMQLQALPELDSFPILFISSDSSTFSLLWRLCFIQSPQPEVQLPTSPDCFRCVTCLSPDNMPRALSSETSQCNFSWRKKVPLNFIYIHLVIF